MAVEYLGPLESSKVEYLGPLKGGAVEYLGPLERESSAAVVAAMAGGAVAFPLSGLVGAGTALFTGGDREKTADAMQWVQDKLTPTLSKKEEDVIRKVMYPLEKLKEGADVSQEWTTAKLVEHGVDPKVAKYVGAGAGTAVEFGGMMLAPKVLGKVKLGIAKTVSDYKSIKGMEGKLGEVSMPERTVPLKEEVKVEAKPIVEEAIRGKEEAQGVQEGGPQVVPEGKITKPASDINRAMVESGMAELPEDSLARYTPITKADQIHRVASLMDADMPRAIEIATGKAKAPPDVHPQVLYNAVKKAAYEAGDVDTMRGLANSPLATERSVAAQTLGAAGWDNKMLADPVQVMQDVTKVRTEAVKKQTGKAPNPKKSAAEVDRTRIELDKAEKALGRHINANEIVDVIKAEVAKEKRQEKRIYKKKELDVEFDSLVKEFNKTIGGQFNVGIDPTAIPIIGRMAKNRVRSGMLSAEAVVDSIYTAIKKMGIEISRGDIKDAIANYNLEHKDASSLKSYKTRMKNEEKKYSEKLDNLDFSDSRRKIVLDNEGKQLKFNRDRAKLAYKSAQEKIGTVTREEATKIVELSKDMESKRAAIEQGGNRIEYGAARVAFEDYINDIKGMNKPLKEVLKGKGEEYKTTWKEHKAKAVWDVTSDAVKTISENSIGMVATLDNSFIGRQGLKTLKTHPTAWYPAAKKSFVDFWNTLGGKDAHKAMMADIYSRENYLNGLYEKAKVIASSEEQYPTNLPERIPYVGRVFKASENAFTGSGMRMRTDLFDLIAKQAKENGVNLNDKVQVESIGKMINSLTARGQWGKKGEGPLVRVLLWAPKMLKANYDVLTMHSGGVGLESAFARKQAAMNLLKIIAFDAVLLSIADAMVPGSVEWDTRSSASGSIKVGDTYFDITGGAASLITLASRIATQSTKSMKTGRVTDYEPGMGHRTSMDALIDFTLNKTSPPAGVVRDWLRMKHFGGEEFSWGQAAYQAFTPISVQNSLKLKDDASADRVAAVIADGVGISARQEQ
jgi:hypothetical protein